jgi:hypothetical protein
MDLRKNDEPKEPNETVHKNKEKLIPQIYWIYKGRWQVSVRCVNFCQSYSAALLSNPIAGGATARLLGTGASMPVRERGTGDRRERVRSDSPKFP